MSRDQGLFDLQEIIDSLILRLKKTEYRKFDSDRSNRHTVCPRCIAIFYTAVVLKKWAGLL